MITGMVNANLEAIFGLTVLGTSGQQEVVETLLDTGFSGFLTLPAALISALRLTWLGREQGMLADGTAVTFDVYSAAILWDGHARAVEVEAVEAAPLAGMALLARHDVRMAVVPGGAFTISALP